MKYICALNEETGKEEIFIFPKTVDHDAVEEVLSGIKNHTHGRDWKRIQRTLISAGFVSRNMICYGRSFTLDLDSREEVDTELIKLQLSQI